VESLSFRCVIVEGLVFIPLKIAISLMRFIPINIFQFSLDDVPVDFAIYHIVVMGMIIPDVQQFFVAVF